MKVVGFGESNIMNGVSQKENLEKDVVTLHKRMKTGDYLVGKE